MPTNLTIDWGLFWNPGLCLEGIYVSLCIHIVSPGHTLGEGGGVDAPTQKNIKIIPCRDSTMEGGREGAKQHHACCVQSQVYLNILEDI